ncbi:hypothetical protein D3C72_2022790 [compost metagenome]
MGKHILSRCAQRGLHRPLHGKKPIEQQFQHVLITAAGDQGVQRHPAHDQPAVLAVNIRQHGFGSDDVFETTLHGVLLWLLAPR